MARHHVIISGTGRAGTTLLMQLLTALRLNTGYRDPHADISPNCNAGMERDIREPNAPYIIKSPWLCDCLDDILEEGTIVIDHALIPVRDLYGAAESRRRVRANSDPADFNGEIPGGLWHTDDPTTQEDILTHQLYELIHTLAKHDVPTTLLYFPRLIHDPAYLYKKLRGVLGWVRYRTFLRAYERVCRPQLVHEFRKDAGDLSYEVDFSENASHNAR